MYTDIKGHPSVKAQRYNQKALNITVCATCEKVSSILFLSQDRWFCTNCREEGDTRPTQIAVSNPARKRVR